MSHLASGQKSIEVPVFLSLLSPAAPQVLGQFPRTETEYSRRFFSRNSSGGPLSVLRGNQPCAGADGYRQLDKC
jgi:hypothetical protein